MSSVFLTPTAAASMRIRGSTLPHDILGHFLRASPTFDTLHAAVGVCKTWHGVFAAHPKSVVLSVAQNIVGPALPQAVRFLRYPYPEKRENEWGTPEDEDEEAAEDESVTEEDTEDEDDSAAKRKPQNTKATKAPAKKLAETDDIGDLTPEERARLQKNAGVVNQLEDIFSLRHKDRTSKTSQLTALESRRFARAMYRVMLYCELFYLPLNLDDIDSLEDEPEELEKIQKARRALLNEYPTPELLEIRAAVAFLHELIEEVLDDGDFDRLKDICISTGPAVILQAYLTKATDVFEEAHEPEVMTSGEDNALFGAFFSTPMEAIWTDRAVVPPESEWDAILDEVCGQSDACAQCGVVAGLKLWSETNWQNLINVDFCALLKGNLSKNDVETALLVDLFMSTCDSALVVSEIFEMRTPEFTAWKKADALCSACLDKLVSAHLHLWLYKRKVQDGWKAPQNCWYGYNCNTQIHKRNHAKEKNHLCAPIR
ncbi:hypothetical protein FB451DRAFT_1146309 [Mycena latifolia]|nr:hypothetical protein FB451DRAFT_1146309 [Mycena latifolia]